MTRSGSKHNTASLDALRERLTALEHQSVQASPIPTGLDEIDQALPQGGLCRGGVHEWIGIDADRPDSGRRWLPPLSVLIHMTCQAMTSGDEAPGHSICWIGQRIWPAAQSIAHARGRVLERSLFIDSVDAPSRLWAADLALRSHAALVLADASGFDMASTRRLQLAAEGSGGLIFLARPPWEVAELSAASTRWLVRREASGTGQPAFGLVLKRAKGRANGRTGRTGRITGLGVMQEQTVIVRRCGCDRLVVATPGVSDRPGEASAAAECAGADRPVARRASA